MDENPDLLSNQELMAAAGRQDTSALGHLVRRHQGSVMRLAYRLLGQWDLAEDVSQETFVRMYAAARRYRPEAKFSTWLYRIVVNLCHDVWRRAGRAAVAAERWPPPQAGPTPSEHLERRERADLVRGAIAGLPERQRTAVVLHRFQDLSLREIAQVTGWSESAVESLLVRAYAQLRRALADLKEE